MGASQSDCIFRCWDDCFNPQNPRSAGRDSPIQIHPNRPEPIANQLSFIDWNQVNVGFTGTELVGKSTLIRSLMGLSHTDNGGPPVTEEGSELPWSTYCHPRLNHVTLHEIPYGRGTNAALFQRFNLICVLIGDRLLETDNAMVERLLNENVSMLLLRTKADLALKQVKRRQKGMSDDEAKFQLRSSLMEFLRVALIGDRLGEERILIISAWEMTEGNDNFMDETKLKRKIAEVFVPQTESSF